MRHTILAFALLLFAGNGLEGAALTRPIGFELQSKQGLLKARVFADSENVLLDYPPQLRGYLFRPASYVYFNHREKTYSVHSYADLVSGLRKTNPPKSDGESVALDSSRGGFRSTGEIDLLAGFNANKMVSLHRTKGRVEMWIGAEITPAKLRAVGDEIMHILPTDYWDDNNPVPSLVQAILLFGVPLRIVDSESESNFFEAVPIKEDDVPLNAFQIPSDYRLLQ